MSAKLFSLQDATKYAKEIEVLAQKLKRAYLNEGFTVTVADAVNATRKAIVRTTALQAIFEGK